MPTASQLEHAAAREALARKRRRRRLVLLAALVLCSAALAAIESRGARNTAASELLSAASPIERAAEPTPSAAGWSLSRWVSDLGEVSYYRFEWLRELANRRKGPVRIGLQVGHLDAVSAPDELIALRQSTGGYAADLNEVDVNMAVATALAARLEQRGFLVDLLSTTVPPGYRADLMLSIHADASADEQRRGYKSAHFRPARNRHEALLKVAVDRAFFRATSLPDDDRNVSGNMLFYYAFNDRRFQHSVHASTPALLVELGYLSNAADREWLQRPDTLAAVLERGVVAYLTEIRRLEP